MTQRVCRTLRPVSEENGILEIEVPDRFLSVPVHLFGLDFPGLDTRPINRLVGFCPNLGLESSG